MAKREMLSDDEYARRMALGRGRAMTFWQKLSLVISLASISISLFTIYMSWCVFCRLDDLERDR